MGVPPHDALNKSARAGIWGSAGDQVPQYAEVFSVARHAGRCTGKNRSWLWFNYSAALASAVMSGFAVPAT